MGFIFGEPKIESDERQKCLAYLEKEFEISIFLDRESKAFENAIQEVTLNGTHGKEFQERISSAANRLAKASEEIVKRRAKLGNIPAAASPVYSAWHRMYLAYAVWITEQAAQQAKQAKVLIPIVSKHENEIVSKLSQEYVKYKAEAAKKHQKLLKRLELSSSEAQKIFNDALAAVEADNWQSKESKESQEVADG